MLASDKPEHVSREDMLTLLDALLRNVRKTDDWENWVDADDGWTDGKVSKCIEQLIEKESK